MTTVMNWIRNNKKEFIILIIVLVVGAFLRLYRISEYMTFLADEGRDVLIVRRLLTQGDLIFVGPGTSIGTMYLGPLYYYMMAPALLLSNFSPVGPSVMVALVGVATIFLVWIVTRDWFGKIPAFFAASLYATSTVVIIFSRSSWNPNVMPFFSLLCIYSIWKVYESTKKLTVVVDSPKASLLDKKQKFGWLVVLGISFSAVTQSHYLGLMLVPTLLVFWILSLMSVWPEKVALRSFIKFSLFGLSCFLFLLLPLILFDYKHEFRNFHAMLDFATGSKQNYSPSIENTISKILPMFKLVVSRLFSPQIPNFGVILAAITLITSFFVIVKKNSSKIYLLLLWLGFGCLGLALLRQDVYDHYFGFLFPAPFILLAGVISYMKDFTLRTRVLLGKKPTIWDKWFVMMIFLVFNLLTLPVFKTPNMQYPRSVAIAKKIVEVSNGNPFHLATISESNNRDPFLYNLLLMKAPVVDIDAQNYDATLVDQLFVICERLEKDCDPTHNSSSWISNFGWSRIENSWNVWGVTIYKLVHTDEWLQNRRK